MVVTKVNYFVKERKNWSYPLAQCSVVLDDVLKLNGICIYEGANGKYITFPNTYKHEEGTDGDSKPVKRNKNEIYHPVSKDFLEYLRCVIIDGYQKWQEGKSFTYSPTDAEKVDSKEKVEAEEDTAELGVENGKETTVLP